MNCGIPNPGAESGATIERHDFMQETHAAALIALSFASARCTAGRAAMRAE